MKSMLRKISLNTISTLEKNENDTNKVLDTPLCFVKIENLSSQKVDCFANKISDNIGINRRKYSVPSRVLMKISLRNVLTRKRSTSVNRTREIVERSEQNDIFQAQCNHSKNPNEEIKIKNDNVRLRPFEPRKSKVNNASPDVLLRCRRFSEMNISTNNNESITLLTPPFPSSSSGRISRLSVANISNYHSMSRRQKRHSLSEFGFGKVESYSKYEILGKGTYSTVFKGQSLLTKDIVALKEVKLEEAEGAPCTAIREISLLRDLRHPNIVTLHDIIYLKNYLTLVFEYMEKNLKQYMDERDNNLEMSTVKSFMNQLLSGLEFCHHRRILHRDLKPQNLLINDKHELKLADFGLARAKSIPTKTYSNEVVTLWYRPPDLLLGKTDYSGNIDIWGAGCIFVEMINGKALFPGHTEEYQLNLIFEKLGSLNNDEWAGLELTKPRFQFHEFPYTPKPSSLMHLISRLDQRKDDELKELLLGFLHLVGAYRFTASQALQFPYFSVAARKSSNVSVRSCNSSSSSESTIYVSPSNFQPVSTT